MNRLKELIEHVDKSTNTCKRRKRVYVAGKMSDPNPITFLNNLAKGIKASVDVLKAGYAPFSPFIDFQYFISNPENNITIDEIQDSSIAWLLASDAMLVLPGYEFSKGTLREIDICHQMHIDIYYDFGALKKGLPL